MKRIMYFIILYNLFLVLGAKDITVGIYENKPLVYIDEKKQPQGLYIDIIEEIALKEHWKIIYIYRSWEECLSLLKKDSLDLLVDIAYSETRDSIYDFNSENVFINWGQVYSSKNSQINNILDISGKRVVGVEKDIYFEETLKMLNKFGVITDVSTVKEYSEVFQKLEDKEADIGVVNRLFGILKDKDYKVNMTGIMIRPSELRFASPQGKNSELLSAIDYNLRNMKNTRNSVYFKSMNHYLSGIDEPTAKISFIDFKSSLIISLTLLLCIAVIFYFKIKLKLKNYDKIHDFYQHHFDDFFNSLLGNCILIDDLFNIEKINDLFLVNLKIDSDNLINQSIFKFVQVNESFFGKEWKKAKVKFTFNNANYDSIISLFPIFSQNKIKYLLIFDLNYDSFNLPINGIIDSYFSFFDSTPIPIILSDIEGQIIYSNQSFLSELEFNNFSSFNNIHHSVFDIFDGLKIQVLHEKLQSYNDQNDLVRFKSNVYRNYGESTPYEILIKKWSFNDSDYLIFSFKNESSEKELAVDVHYRTLFFKELFEKTPLAIAILNEDKVIMDINKEFSDIFGYGKEESINKSLKDLVIPDEFQYEFEEIFETILDNKNHIKKTIRKNKNNDLIPVKIFGSAIQIEDKFAGIFAIYEDLSEEKKTLDILSESVEILDGFMEKAKDIIIILKPDSRIERISNSFTQIFGYTGSEIYDSKSFFLNHVHPDDRIQQNSWFFDLNNDEDQKNSQFRFMKNDGNYLWLEEKAVVLKNNNNKTEHILIISRDISNYKLNEEKLIHQKKFIANIMDRVEDGILNIGIDGKINYINSSITNMFYETKENLINKSVFDIINLEGNFNFNSKFLYDLYMDGEKQFYNVFLKIKHSDKKIVSNISSMPINSEENGKTLLLFIRDLTYQKKIQSELQKLKNLEIMQNYTLHLANDFNNILTAIMGHISLLKMNPNIDSSILERVKKAEDASKKAIELTQKIFPIDSNQNIIRDYYSLRSLIEFIEHSISESFTLNTFLQTKEDQVYINQSLTESLIKKIIDNAMESMPKGGNLVLRSDEIVFDENNIFSLNQGKYVKLSIIDQGCGIDEQHMDKIFDPYFSTKNKEGLGLTQAFHLMKMQKGYIQLQSQKNIGTFVDIFLPLNPYEEVVLNEADIDLSNIRILFMDDEMLVNDIAEEYLTRFGFKITIIKKGEEMLSILEQGIRFDCYILDLVIGDGMGAKDTVHKIREVDSQAKVILSTGLKTEPTLLDFRKYGFDDYIEKPIDFHLLKTKILRLVIN